MKEKTLVIDQVVSKVAVLFHGGTSGSNPCTLQGGYWLVGIVDWPDRAGLPGVSNEPLPGIDLTGRVALWLSI